MAAAAMTYGVGVAQNNADLGGGGGMNDEEYDENSSARLFERSRIKALAGPLSSYFDCSLFILFTSFITNSFLACGKQGCSRMNTSFCTNRDRIVPNTNTHMGITSYWSIFPLEWSFLPAAFVLPRSSLSNIMSHRIGIMSIFMVTLLSPM
ncbi:hypothetical protein Y032_0058g2919 [Ancylostoma ceylanicum]|uniref:Uncharacterized protein n=1 Tax=Ancylostoma ceylanicum TaxID=53326 RepID=A0A016U3W1_9BILA|nr:hypothetical protein Y032_0058g2919 [Ancylostoma ceylanicum]